MRVKSLGAEQGDAIGLHPMADRASAEAALHDEVVDAVIVDGRSLLVLRQAPSELAGLVQTAVRERSLSS